MPKGENQKLKLFYLSKILQEKTDFDHSITMSEIRRELEKYDVSAERKSIYSDIKELEKLGIEVEGEQNGRSYSYKVVGRQFELPELKLLVDAIQSSKFITERKSRDLIKKLEGFASEYEAKKLQRQVFVQGRIKTMNESIYYSVDTIHTAIAENKQIKFQYFAWNVKKEMELKHDGKYYEISPWGLSWDDENYYLVAYDSSESKIKHFRVDKMLRISLIDKLRDGQENFKWLDMAEYSKKSFGMYGGEEVKVRIEFDNKLVGVFIDRFGKDIQIRPINEQRSSTMVSVVVSGQFYGWLMGLGADVKIASPEHVAKEAGEYAKRIVDLYTKENT